MNKEAYELDENFNNLIRDGNRRNLSCYRNFIIDELKARTSPGARHSSCQKLSKLRGSINEEEVEKTLQKDSKGILAMKKSILDEKLGL